MECIRATSRAAAVFSSLLLFCLSCRTCLAGVQTAFLNVDASPAVAQPMPETLFGVFFEEINHAGAGGIWSELVSNRGFEAGGLHFPANIAPWSHIGDESNILLTTDHNSCFPKNIVTLRMEVRCDHCPTVGIYNPGYWGMNIEYNKAYNLVMFVKTLAPAQLTVAITNSDGSHNLASATIHVDPSNWTRVEQQLVAKETDRQGRLQIVTNQKGVVWFDQVSLMPVDTFKGHGFRSELISMVLDLKPAFLRFPGGTFVEGDWLGNGYRWKETIGPWEERPGHLNDVWGYWSDDGIGYYEYLQLAEDLGAAPIWVANIGMSDHFSNQVDVSNLAAFLQEALDSIEFARGSADSQWGSVRAAMGHPDPFSLKYVAIGNEQCWEHPWWRDDYIAHYLVFYNAIREAYPDIQMISNCDFRTKRDHPTDLWDFHVYAKAGDLYNMKDMFDKDKMPRSWPKVFASEFAVNGWGAGPDGIGSLYAALTEAAFAIEMEKNSDIVSMASYAPLFANKNDRLWKTNAINFNTWQQYGIPSYWMLTFFRDYKGNTLHPSTITTGDYAWRLSGSAITCRDGGDRYLRVKVLNYGDDVVNLTISTTGLDATINGLGSYSTVQTSGSIWDYNYFDFPNKVVPVSNALPNAAEHMQVVLAPNSLNSFSLALAPKYY